MLVTKPGHKLDADLLSIQVAMVIEDIGLDGGRIIVGDGRVISDVRHATIQLLPDQDTGDVDARLRIQLSFLREDIRGWKPIDAPISFPRITVPLSDT